MKKLVLALTVVGALMPGAPPAQAHGGSDVSHPIVFPFAGTVPCSLGFTADLCPYNLPASALGYKACENPGPVPNSWVDVLTEPAPTPPAGQRLLLKFESFPQFDWDTFICALLPGNNHNGGELAAGANILGDNCDNLLGNDNPVPVGCEETAQAPAVAGVRYVLRAYNYWDFADMRAKYTWIFV